MMIFNIDHKNIVSTALKDDFGLELSYGELHSLIIKSGNLLPERSLILVIADNDIPSMTFILSCLQHKWVPLVLSKVVDSVVLNMYIETYNPNAIFHNKNQETTSPPKLDSLDWYHYHIDIIHKNPHIMYSELAFLLPTSGSTGSPKLVRHSYNNIISSAQNVSNFFCLNASDKSLAILPIFYTMGFSVVSSGLQAGAVVRLSTHPLTDRSFWEILKNEGISILTGVPYTFEVLFKMRFQRMKYPSLRIITQGGGKLSSELWDALVLYSKNNDIAFIPTYGQTEGTARMSYLDSSYVMSKKGSIGKAIPSGSFEIWDENGNKIEEIAASGELVYIGPNVTLGYATKLSDLAHGDDFKSVLKTGDIVQRDKDGFYFIIGRKSRFLKIYGFRVSLDEVEHLIKNNFLVDCYASGNDSLLSVYVDDYSVLSEIKHWLVKKTNLFHQAIEVNYIPEIPRNLSGKVIITS